MNFVSFVWNKDYRLTYSEATAIWQVQMVCYVCCIALHFMLPKIPMKYLYAFFYQINCKKKNEQVNSILILMHKMSQYSLCNLLSLTFLSVKWQVIIWLKFDLKGGKVLDILIYGSKGLRLCLRLCFPFAFPLLFLCFFLLKEKYFFKMHFSFDLYLSHSSISS